LGELASSLAAEPAASPSVDQVRAGEEVEIKISAAADGEPASFLEGIGVGHFGFDHTDFLVFDANGEITETFSSTMLGTRTLGVRVAHILEEIEILRELGVWSDEDEGNGETAGEDLAVLEPETT
jgi:hypothetical protein